MCKSGCLLLTLEPAAAGFGRALWPPLRCACAKSWRVWWRATRRAARGTTDWRRRRRAQPLDDVEGGEAADVLLLFDARLREGG